MEDVSALQKDKDLIHRAAHTFKWLLDNDVIVSDCPVCSFDLNIINNVRRVVVREVSKVKSVMNASNNWAML